MQQNSQMNQMISCQNLCWKVRSYNFFKLWSSKEDPVDMEISSDKIMT